jgi:site-specific DNA recombinase
VRVSTQGQVEFSPAAQAKRCRELTRLRDLGAVTVLSDEGWSGKNLERPAMRELLSLVESGTGSHIVTWSLDRLSRDRGDCALLVQVFQRHGVTLHSVTRAARELPGLRELMQRPSPFAE